MRTISLQISTSTLGDNTNTENNRYAAAVEAAIREEYPDANVLVELTDDPGSTCVVTDDLFEEIAENIRIIANQIWGMADY